MTKKSKVGLKNTTKKSSSTRKKSLPLTVKPKFLLDQAVWSPEPVAEAVNVIGFGFEGTACYRKGTAVGPDAIRLASSNIETYSPYLDDDTEGKKIVDLGNLNLGRLIKGKMPLSEKVRYQIEQQWELGVASFNQLNQNRHWLREKIKFLTIGGEHSISYAPLAIALAQFPQLTIIHLDAHADLRDGYEGFHYSHASIMYRIMERLGPGQKLIQFGIRSGTREEFRLMHQKQTLITNPTVFWAALGAISTPIYLRLDLDFFDPAYLPGTGTPEAGGYDFSFLVSLAQQLKQKDFIGADVVELAPSLDPTGNSDVFAAKVIRELLLALA
ncbi:MAG: agmatinase [Bacteriovoracaceae bacterium]|nr:agmatinase [Bacteriovoracaceae bacterium]